MLVSQRVLKGVLKLIVKLGNHLKVRNLILMNISEFQKSLIALNHPLLIVGKLGSAVSKRLIEQLPIILSFVEGSFVSPDVSHPSWFAVNLLDP